MGLFRSVDVKHTGDEHPWSRKSIGWITSVCLALSLFFFLLTRLLQPTFASSEQYAGVLLFSSPVEKTLLYDYPKLYERLFQFIRLYGVEAIEDQEGLPSEALSLYRQINQTAVWPGYYQLLLKGGWPAVQKGLSVYPSFEKIRQGELWRLFTPCLLHGDLFHLFFNMLWLIALGRQIEQRLSPFRYLSFILLLGITSNTAQYLMSGPNFIGFSGILVGMLGFIWARQKKAAWEGYQIDRSTFIFMLIFVLSMAAIQILSFFIEKAFDLALSPNIANMAHLSGGVMGYLLGKSEIFSWRYR